MNPALASVSVLFFLLGADFVGATQLMVYVGGTVVLLIFGVMMTASSPLLRIRTSPAEGFLSAGIGVLFLAIAWLFAVQIYGSTVPTSDQDLRNVNWTRRKRERPDSLRGYDYGATIQFQIKF